jgi:hypothetical protein
MASKRLEVRGKRLSLPHPPAWLWCATVRPHRDDYEAEAGYQGRKEGNSCTSDHPGKEAHDLGDDQRPKV